MSLRHGLTAPEEHKLKTLVSKGTSWDEIVERCSLTDDRGNPQVPLFTDVELSVIKKFIYDPLVKKLEEAKKAGFKDLHAHEASERKKREAAKKAKEE
jgi:hypothetical protein